MIELARQAVCLPHMATGSYPSKWLSMSPNLTSWRALTLLRFPRVISEKHRFSPLG